MKELDIFAFQGKQYFIPCLFFQVAMYLPDYYVLFHSRVLLVSTQIIVDKPFHAVSNLSLRRWSGRGHFRLSYHNALISRHQFCYNSYVESLISILTSLQLNTHRNASFILGDGRTGKEPMHAVKPCSMRITVTIKARNVNLHRCLYGSLAGP